MSFEPGAKTLPAAVTRASFTSVAVKLRSADTFDSVAPSIKTFGRARRENTSFGGNSCFGHLSRKKIAVGGHLRFGCASQKTFGHARRENTSVGVYLCIVCARCKKRSVAPGAKTLRSVFICAAVTSVAKRGRLALVLRSRQLQIDFSRRKIILRSRQLKNFLSCQTQKTFWSAVARASVTSVAKNCGPRTILLWSHQSQKLSVGPGAKISVGVHFCLVRASR